jgi:hypothetical protein
MALQLRLARLEENVFADTERSLIPSVLEAFVLRTPADVLQLLERQIAAVARDHRAGTVERARAIGYLAALSLKAIEADNLAARLEALEEALQRRANNPNRTA